MDVEFLIVVVMALFVIGTWMVVQATYQKIQKIEQDVARLLETNRE